MPHKDSEKRKAYAKQYYEKRKVDPKFKANASKAFKEYRSRNQEKVKQWTATWREKNRERLSLEQAEVRRKRGPESTKALLREQYQKHRDKRRADKREYWAKNKERIKPGRAASAKRYAATHEEALRLHGAISGSRRRARMRAATGNHTLADIRDLFERQAKKCATCKTKISPKKGIHRYHVDHVHPLSRGGSNNLDNLQLLCVRCNLTKQAKTPEQWAKENGLLFC